MVIRDYLEEKKEKLITKISDIENKDYLTKQELDELTRLHAQLRWINKELVSNG